MSATSEGEVDDEDDWTADGLKSYIADDFDKKKSQPGIQGPSS